jgi:hypothetical protein
VLRRVVLPLRVEYHEEISCVRKSVQGERSRGRAVRELASGGLTLLFAVEGMLGYSELPPY